LSAFTHLQIGDSPMNQSSQEVTAVIMARLSQWIKSLVSESATIITPEATAALEQRVRREGQALLGSVLEH